MEAVLSSPAFAMPFAGTSRGRIWGEGEMARLMRRHDWSGSVLGEPEGWPETLSTSVNLILASPVASSVYWGPRQVLLYNDAYRKFMGDRHPRALGRPGAEVWREAWHIVGPQIEHTFSAGESFHGENFHVPIELNGQMVDHYWDYSFSPIYDPQTGRVAGVYNTCSDVTGAVRTTREREGLGERLNELLERTSESVILIDRDWRFTYLNRVAMEFARPLGDLVGRDKWETFPSLSRETEHGRRCIRAMEHGESSEFESYYPEPINRWRHVHVRPAADGIVLFARDITEEKRAAAALKASNDALAVSEEELRWTISLSSQMVWSADADGMLLKHTENLADLTGHAGEEVLGSGWTSLMHPEDVERMRVSWSASVRKGEPHDIEFRMHTVVGEYRWLRARAYPRRNAEGKIIKWYGITEDIDGQRRAAAALKASNDALTESEEELRWTICVTGQFPWTADADGGITKHTGDLAALCGYSPDEILGDLWPRMMYPDDIERMRETWSACVRTGEPYDIEHRMRTADGGVRWLRARAYPRRDSVGRIVKWYGITEDIDQRKRAEAGLKASNEALAASEEELRWTVKMSTQNPWTADAAGKLLSGGDILLEYPGRPSEVLLDKQWNECVHPEDKPKVQAAWRHSVRTGEPFDLEHRWRTASGEFHWLRARAYPRRDSDGTIVKWYGTTEDIHARKRYAETLEETAIALAASEEELRWTVKMSTQNPWTADPCGRLLSADEGFEVTGVSKEDLLGERWLDVVHPEDASHMAAHWARCVATGEVYEFEFRMQTAEGDYRWHRARGFSRRDAAGRIVKWYGNSEDIHARKVAEEALRTTEKLAAVGRLATSIAHEINNPLEAVTNLLYLAGTSEELTEVLSYIKTAEQELHRASVIANQTLRFQRQSSGAVPLDSRDLIENCLAVFQGKLQNSAVTPDLRLRARRALTCYDGEIRQVFLNLVGNAIDAMQPGGGRLVIRTREATHPKTGHTGLVLTVADTGSGIPPEAQKRLFEPFFTTKGINGTGLGLWVSKDIVARHHGTLRLRSTPRQRRTDPSNGGTVFTLFLPYDALTGRTALPAAERHELVAA